MKRATWRWLVAGCGAVAVASALAVAWLRAEAVALRAELEAARFEAGEVGRLRAEKARLREEQVSPEEMKALRVRKEEVRRLRAEIDALERGAAASAKVDGSGVGRRPPAPGGEDNSARLEARYGQFLAEVGLPLGRIADLKRILTERQQAEVNAVAEARRRQGDPNALAVKQRVIDGRAAAETRLRAEFGDAVYAQFKDYEWTLSARQMVAQLKWMLGRTSTPLQKEQAERLVPLLAAARGEGEFVAEDRAKGLMPYRVRVTPGTLRAAGAVLEPEQRGLLKEMTKGP